MQENLFEIQALTWKARAIQQQDAVFIDNRVIQHKGLISKKYIYEANQYWCVAVADGVSHSPAAQHASQLVLHALNTQAVNQPDKFDFQDIQHALNQQLFQNSHFYGASTTLALLSCGSPHGFVNIQHLGDSRAYLYSYNFKKWYCITQDHNYIEQLATELTLKHDVEYASIYKALMHYFCIDPLHEVPQLQSQEEFLNEGDALLICTDGVHDILHSDQWADLTIETPLKSWLLEMKHRLKRQTANDNISMIIVRLR